MELRLPARRLPAWTAQGGFSPTLSPAMRTRSIPSTLMISLPAPSTSFFKMKPSTSMVSEIQEPLRNQGIGTRAAAALIEELNRSARPQLEDLPVAASCFRCPGTTNRRLHFIGNWALHLQRPVVLRVLTDWATINRSLRRTDVPALAPASFSYTSRIIQYCFKSKCFSTTRTP